MVFGIEVVNAFCALVIELRSSFASLSASHSMLIARPSAAARLVLLRWQQLTMPGVS